MFCPELDRVIILSILRAEISYFVHLQARFQPGVSIKTMIYFAFWIKTFDLTTSHNLFHLVLIYRYLPIFYIYMQVRFLEKKSNLC